MKKMTHIFLLPLLLFPLVSFAAAGEAFHTSTLVLLVMLGLAKICGVLCEKIHLPSLVGELFAGIALGNLALFGLQSEALILTAASPFFVYAAELGVVFLLFLVGLESSISGLMKSGKDAFFTAMGGVILPTAGGYFAVTLLNLGSSMEAWFVGATFAATSVGITARVLSQYNKLATPSAQVILGAAVVDDILGLMLLAGLVGMAEHGSLSVGTMGIIIFKTGIFFVGAFLTGKYLLPQAFRLYPSIDQPGILTAMVVIIALGFADLAYLAGLAPIVGAFTAGLLLDDVKLKHAGSLKIESIEEVIKPVTDLLLPIFFVSIGLQVKLASISTLKSLGLVLLLLIIALVGKILCGFAARAKGVDKIGVGLGMIPRGEVGLIFATYGLHHDIFSSYLYSILVMVVLLTTIIGPVGLKLRMKSF